MKTVLPYSDLPTDGGKNFHVEIAHSKLSPAVPVVAGQAAANGAAGQQSFSQNVNYSNNMPNPENDGPRTKGGPFLHKHGLG
jgi:hypothetical protein